MATTITPRIVTVNEQVTRAPSVSQLQQSGAIVSVGGTTLTTNSYQYCGTVAAVEAILGTAGNFAELQNMATTFFAQGNVVGLYVLELGVQTSDPLGITALETWISAQSTQVFYAYLVPVAWDSTALNTMAMNYNSPSAKTYFFVTTTTSTISEYAATKSVFALVPSPTAASTEFQAAMPFYQWLANNPHSASPAAPMSYRFAYGVTPWDQTLAANVTSIDTVLTAGGNVILTGAEGGISTATLYKGTTMDGQQAMFWYAADWFAIQAKRQLANAIINGSNSNPPLVYNQRGINTLEALLNQIGATSVANGLNLSYLITATPFYTYTQQNPSDYDAGKYDGFAATITPQLGFLTITFNLDAVQFVTGG